MRVFLVLIVYLKVISYVVSQCAQNAQGTTGNCLCIQGYYGTNAEVGGQCIKCPSGTNTTTPNNSANGNTNPLANINVCNQCSLNFYMNTAAINTKPFTSAQCTPCPTGSGTLIPSTTPTDVSFCTICVPNYYMSLAAFPPQQSIQAYAAVCLPCPANSFSPIQNQVGTISNCVCFDSNAIQLSQNQFTCTCQNGYQGIVSNVQGGTSGCSSCPSGMFSVGGIPCQSCPPGSSILNDFSGCSCYDISDGTTPWNIYTNSCQCQAGYYGDPSKAQSGSTNSCSLCPNGQTSIQGVALQDSDCFQLGNTFKTVISFQFFILQLLLILL